MIVADFGKYITEFAPFSLSMDFDNTGLLVGSYLDPVTHVGVVLDVTPEAVAFAVANGIDLIISHHPVIFSPLKRLDSNSVPYLLAKHGIAVISAHTNLDRTYGGVNDVLYNLFELNGLKVDTTDNEPNLLRMGDLTAKMSPEDFAQFVKDKLGADSVRYVSGNKMVKSVAVCGGSGGDLITDIKKFGCDALVTGEMKHHEMLYAKENGLTAVVAGHFETEQPMMRFLANRISADFEDVKVTLIPQTSPSKAV